MGYDSDSPWRNGREEDDEEEYEESDKGNRFLGFMFGNVDNSGDLDVDYLDEDAKEHLSALADKLGPSLTDIDLSGKSPQTPHDVVEQGEVVCQEKLYHAAFDVLLTVVKKLKMQLIMKILMKNMMVLRLKQPMKRTIYCPKRIFSLVKLPLKLWRPDLLSLMMKIMMKNLIRNKT